MGRQRKVGVGPGVDVVEKTDLGILIVAIGNTRLLRRNRLCQWRRLIRTVGIVQRYVTVEGAVGAVVEAYDLPGIIDTIRSGAITAR
jgi:hypothetical protein